MPGATILAIVQEAPDRWAVFASNEHVYVITRGRDGLYQWGSHSFAYSDWGQYSGWYKRIDSCKRHLAGWLARWYQPDYAEGAWLPPRERARDGVYWGD